MLTLNKIIGNVRVFFSRDPFLKLKLCDACTWRRLKNHSVLDEQELGDEIDALHMKSSSKKHTFNICGFCKKRLT